VNLASKVSDSAARHVQAVIDALRGIDLSALPPIAEALSDVRRRGGQVFVAGNGGSASVAAHLALSLTHDLTQRGASPLAAIALTEAAQLTAIANDRGADYVFVDQLRPRLRPTDAVVALSASGQSRNVMAALSFSSDLGATTILITGAAQVQAQCGLCLAFDCSDAAVAEDVFAVVGHALTAMLAHDPV
jgi:phosphoheptose isomerase